MSLIPLVEWSQLDPARRAAWLAGLRPPAPEADVAGILDDVRARGDDALREATRRLDGVDLADPWASDAELDAAEVDPELEAALRAAADAIRRFHADGRDALRVRRVVQTRPGITAWRRWAPLGRIGVYVAGGRAPYASSVLMLGIPAGLAGVDDVILATPPGRDGQVPAPILVAARMAGIRRLLKAGGAQAVAALAYGTGRIPAVDKVFGAGNAWVTAAKRAVAGDVAIDLPAGPSECVVIADSGADPDFVALDLLAQAEHGPDSVAVVVSADRGVLDAVEAAVERLAPDLPTGAAALETLRRLGSRVLVTGLDSAVAVADAVAAEHVSLQCADADRLAAELRSAGAIFLGPWSAIAAGDYATGTNHVLPTGGAARAWSGVGIEAFGRWTEMQRLTAGGIREVAATVAAISRAEGLAAHGASVRLRAERAGDAREVGDVLSLLRRPDPVAPYPAEPSDEELAARAGIEPGRVVRADMNTLGGGALPAVRDGMGAYDVRGVAEYGDLAYARLRTALGSRVGVDGRRIVPGAGADELIRLVTSVAVGDGDSVVVPTPTFAMFAVEARLAGARVVDVPRTVPACRQPAAEIRAAAEAASARLVWLCTPNNPTGDPIPLDEIRAVAAGLPALVCVDEVYLEFGEDSTGAAAGSTSAIALQDDLPNLLVLRSLAKSHGLAGARVGYLVVSEALADRFDSARLPLSVGAPSEALALAAVSDEEGARARRAEVIAARDRLAAVLAELGSEVLPSVTNFVAFRPSGQQAAHVDEALLARGVAVRRYTQGPMAGWLRATARIGEEEARLMGALREVLA